MQVLKCKMCGANLEIEEGLSVTECEYCGSKNTLPKLNDEKKAVLFDRANFYRVKNEFDKASLIYENIVAETPDEAEAYWGICLCRYGIEYVVDPKSKKRVPTCHRTQFKSILEDEDYNKAYETADILAKTIYKEEAEYIDSVQKTILEISSKEEPFDIFICYKQTDDSTGDRTVDSLIAEDIYNELTANGYNVFFSMITLEDKLGMAYEPYIFSALNSAKVMLVIGTKTDYLNAVWVKNEWSRYLALIEQGQKKIVIPCYRDISPHELPDEFAILQAQDVSKIGWKQDLVRGIDKIINRERDFKKIEKKDTNNNYKEIALESGLYIGEAIADKPHGRGKCIYANGGSYEGEWSFGKQNGTGIFNWNANEKWEGEWKEGKPWNGSGVWYDEMGIRWEGEFKENKADGQCEARYSDGEYIGEWKSGLREGKGVWKFNSGEKWEGEWKDDHYWIGTGVYEHEDGKYIGEIYRGEKQGYGKYIWKFDKSLSWEGKWSHDRPWEGKGVWKYSDSVYIGQLQKGMRVGHGKICWLDKNNKYSLEENYWEGEWKDDSPWNGTGDWPEQETLSGILDEKDVIVGFKKTTIKDGSEKTEGCYIATCVYGSYDCPEVWTLRRYRDKVLSKNIGGRMFIRIYYAVSPYIVECFGKTKWFNKFCKEKLDIIVNNLNNKGFENSPYEDNV